MAPGPEADVSLKAAPYLRELYAFRGVAILAIVMGHAVGVVLNVPGLPVPVLTIQVVRPDHASKSGIGFHARIRAEPAKPT